MADAKPLLSAPPYRYTAASLDGPWAVVRPDQLPAAFKDIPPASALGEVRVSVEGRARDAFTYRARPERIAPELLPYRWYRELVLLGARHHGLPEAYVASLGALAVRDDPDAMRGPAMDALVARLRESPP